MTSLVPLGVIPIYHVASRINQLIKRFLGFPVVAMQPEVTRIYEEGRWHELEGRIALFTKATVVVSLACAAVAAAVGREAIVLMSGEQYAGAYPLLLVLLGTVPVAAYVAPLGATMRALHFMWWAVLCDFAWMAAYFAGMFLFMPRAGLIGAALAQSAAYIFYTALSIEFARRRRFLGGRGIPAMARALVVCSAAGAAGAAACALWGLPAAAACVVLLPLLIRAALHRTGIFERGEAEAIAAMIPPGPVRRVVRWALSLEREKR
jgi:O-antigen/teichoic acid export membrane protein